MQDRTETYDSLEMLKSIALGRFDADGIRDTLSKITTSLAKCIGSSSCAIILNDNQDHHNEVFGNSDFAPSPEITEHNPLIDKVLGTGNPDRATSDGIVSICVPVKYGGEIYGGIFAQVTAPTEDTQCLLETTGLYIAMAIQNVHLAENAQQNEKLATAGKTILNLSHSVKNLLQMVSGAAEVIDLGLKTQQMDRVQRSWDILNPNLNRLRKFMLDMLTYSKKRPLQVEICDFNKIIADSIESLRAQLSKEMTPKINFGIDRAIPAVRLDGEMILEMALNIILNAIEIVDEKNGVVSVETHYLHDKKAIELVVVDNGKGMDGEMKEKLFVPFESGKAKMGTGLGMAIAKQIIDRHNGAIIVESEVGKGTTMRVRLPVDFVG
jgi:signal transduction histidine kinase